MIELQPRIYPRGIYYGTRLPTSYYEINRHRFPGQLDAKTTHGDTQSNPVAARLAKEASYPLHYMLFANEEGLDSSVKIIPLPVRISHSLSNRVISEMSRLRDENVLLALRGGRRTDLIRPMRPEVRERVKSECPHLPELITSVEGAIAGSDLYIRALKLDEARMSTTQADPDRAKPNLHYDAEGSSIQEYPVPVYQYYANIAYFPRQFRILPLPLSEITSALIQNRFLTQEQAATLPVASILDQFVDHFDAPVEEIIVESGQLAIFDGRVFAHDAGKGRISDLKRGRFIPTKEPDFLLALDTPKSGYHQGYYFPELSFLEDTGTEAWWDLAAKFYPIE